MNTHEKHCTANIDRECRICIHNTGVSTNIKEIIEGYKLRFKIVYKTQFDEDFFVFETVEWIGDKITLQEVRDAVGNCPNCILSIMRQCKFHWDCFDEDCGFKDFDYKKELAAKMAEWKHDYSDY